MTGVSNKYANLLIFGSIISGWFVSRRLVLNKLETKERKQRLDKIEKLCNKRLVPGYPSVKNFTKRLPKRSYLKIYNNVLTRKYNFHQKINEEIQKSVMYCDKCNVFLTNPYYSGLTLKRTCTSIKNNIHGYWIHNSKWHPYILFNFLYIDDDNDDVVCGTLICSICHYTIYPFIYEIIRSDYIKTRNHLRLN